MVPRDHMHCNVKHALVAWPLFAMSCCALIMETSPEAKRKKPKPKWRRDLKAWINMHIVLPIGFVLFRLLVASWRKTRVHHERCKIKPGIVTVWHTDALAGSPEMRHIGPDADLLTSRSRDGDLMARVAKLWGARVIRGSSSKGAVGAILAMRRSLRRSSGVIIAADGPRGPARIAKPGVVAVASQAGAPILPLGVWSDRVWRFHSWDSSFLPKPFARVVFHYDEPMQIPTGLDKEGIQEWTRKLEERLNALHDKLAAER